MKSLIIGGTGFIGSNLVRKLVNDGEEVGLLVREQSKTWRIKDLLTQIDLLKGDLMNGEVLKELIQNYKPDFIYHLGAYGNSQAFQKDKDKMFSVNVEGTLNLIDAAKGIPIINIGSSSEYGPKDKAMKESDQCNPNNLYGKTKLLQTLYCKEQEIPTLRLFSVYGPLENSNKLIPTLIKSKLNNEDLHLINSVRDYVYVEDVVEAIIKSRDKYDSIKGEIINIGSGKQYSPKEVLKELDKIDSKELNISWDFHAAQIEPKEWISDISKSKDLLNWEPQTNLGEGLMKTYKEIKLSGGNIEQ